MGLAAQVQEQENRGGYHPAEYKMDLKSPVQKMSKRYGLVRVVISKYQRHVTLSVNAPPIEGPIAKATPYSVCCAGVHCTQATDGLEMSVRLFSASLKYTSSSDSCNSSLRLNHQCTSSRAEDWGKRSNDQSYPINDQM